MKIRVLLTVAIATVALACSNGSGNGSPPADGGGDDTSSDDDTGDDDVGNTDDDVTDDDTDDDDTGDDDVTDDDDDDVDDDVSDDTEPDMDASMPDDDDVDDDVSDDDVTDDDATDDTSDDDVTDDDTNGGTGGGSGGTLASGGSGGTPSTGGMGGETSVGGSGGSLTGGSGGSLSTGGSAGAPAGGSAGVSAGGSGGTPAAGGSGGSTPVGGSGGTGGTPPSGCPGGCADIYACTVDTCVNGACVHTANSSLCNDLDACTTDVCTPGVGCLHNPILGCGGSGGSGGIGGSGGTGGSSSSGWGSGQPTVLGQTTILSGLTGIQGLKTLESSSVVTVAARRRVLTPEVTVAGAPEPEPDPEPEPVVDAGPPPSGTPVQSNGCTVYLPDTVFEFPSDRTVGKVFIKPPIFEKQLSPAPCDDEGVANVIYTGGIGIVTDPETVTTLTDFSVQDATTFFGHNTVLSGFKRDVTLPGDHPEARGVSELVGWTPGIAECGGTLYVSSNGSGTLLGFDLETGARTDYVSGEYFLTGVVCVNEEVFVAAPRIYTTDSMNAAVDASDPGLLVEHTPLRILRLEEDGNFSFLGPILAPLVPAIVLAPWAWVVLEDETALVVKGYGDPLSPMADGRFLVGDHGAGTVQAVSPLDGTPEFLFQAEQAFSSMVEAPDGRIYVMFNGGGNAEGQNSPPTVGYWDATDGLVPNLASVDTYTPEVLEALSDGQFYEIGLNGDEIFLFFGNGSFPSITPDPVEAILFVGNNTTGEISEISLALTP